MRMTGGEALVAGLIRHGIDTVIGLPGAQIYGLFDALKRAENRVRTIGARHEQACGFMAFGYARSTGLPSCYAVVRPVLERALSEGGPWLLGIVVPPDSEASPWPFIMPQRSRSA